jgi:peptidoglycan hydrolase-like protein with peptidoglycan-binding domain
VHRHPVLSAGLVVVALLATGCQSSHETQGSAALAPAVVPTTNVPNPELTGVPEASAVPAVSAPSPSLSPKASPKPAAPTYDVKAVQTRLTDLHYYLGAIDGDRSSRLRSAVMAFQKVNGLSADGSVGKVTLAALKTPKKPVLRGSGSGVRVEVDLTKQVLYIVNNGAITRILPVSSGSGKKYLTKSGQTATALSPVGYYTIERRIVGERHADLGTLYDPQYFYRGWAIHGSNSVPAYPASHGCIRVTRSDAKYLLEAIHNGTKVYIYGGAHTFTAGSSAPGTNDPGGDTPDSTPATAPTPTATARATATATPASSPTGTPPPSSSPSPTPTP